MVRTRKQVIALGERAIERATNVRITLTPALDRPTEVAMEAPEVEAFRQVLATGTAFAFGSTSHDGVVCPMRQTVFGFADSDVGDNVMAVRLAFAFDDAVRDDVRLAFAFDDAVRDDAWDRFGVIRVVG